jgi:hypothetical protein
MTENNSLPPNRNSGPGRLGDFIPIWRLLVWSLLLLVFVYYWAGLGQAPHYEKLAYSEFKERVRADQVTEVRHPDPAAIVCGSPGSKRILQ